MLDFLEKRGTHLYYTPHHLLLVDMGWSYTLCIVICMDVSPSTLEVHKSPSYTGSFLFFAPP